MVLRCGIEGVFPKPWMAAKDAARAIMGLIPATTYEFKESNICTIGYISTYVNCLLLIVLNNISNL